MGSLFYQRKQHTIYFCVVEKCSYLLSVIRQWKYVSYFNFQENCGWVLIKTYLEKCSTHLLDTLCSTYSQQTNSRQCPNVSIDPIKVTRVTSPVCQWGIFYSYHQKKKLLDCQKPHCRSHYRTGSDGYLWKVLLWRTQSQAEFSKGAFIYDVRCFSGIFDLPSSDTLLHKLIQ